MALCGFVTWAALLFATAALSAPPVASIVPLLVLAAAFECVFAMHVGVERIGRYIQVFYEEDDQPGGGPRASNKWEQTAMAFGRPPGAVRLDALFSIPFALAAVINLMPPLIVIAGGPTREELIFVGGAHALFLVRLAAARAAAGKQRSVDLKRFQEMKGR